MAIRTTIRHTATTSGSCKRTYCPVRPSQDSLETTAKELSFLIYSVFNLSTNMQHSPRGAKAVPGGVHTTPNVP